MLPPGMSGGHISNNMMSGSLPAPPESMMRRIRSLMDKQMQRRSDPAKKDNTASERDDFQEALQEIMNDPDSGMKEFLDKAMQFAEKNIPPEKLEEMKSAIKAGKMDLGLHINVMPMGFPGFPGGPQGSNSFPPGVNPGFNENRFNIQQNQNIATKTEDKKSPSASSAATDASIGEKRIPHSGSAFLLYLEEYTMNVPKDLNLKSKWLRMSEEQKLKHTFQANRKALLTEFKKLDLKCADEIFLLLEDSLSSILLSKDDAKRVVLTSLKLQAGQQAVDATNVLSAIPAWALEISLGGVLQSSSHSTSGQASLFSLSSLPAIRSKEEVMNLVTDKHERALVSNIIFPQDIGVSYDMIGGLDEVKETLRQCVTYPLKYPRLYREGVAAEAVKGVLLFGPPGTGKTMLAKAVATEGGATFISVDASTIENKWLGESEKNAKAVFTLARRLAPSVIYLDEVDSVLSSREHGDDSSHGTLTSVKTTLMQEWDGLKSSKDRVIVIASTNRPFDLDEAVLRRLPRRILVDLPDLATRKEILQVTLSDNRMSPNVNLTKIAETLEGYTGSDLKEVCREAVVRISHDRAKQIDSSGLLSNADFLFSEIRPVNTTDFTEAIKRLKASVDVHGREMQKVLDWNEKFGEYKKTGKKSKLGFSLYM